MERVMSVIAGSVLAVYGVRKRGVRGFGLAVLGAQLVHRGASGHCMFYDALGVSTADGPDDVRIRNAVTSPAATVNARKAIKVERTVIINCPRAELYEVWRNFERLPSLIPNLESVTKTGDGRWHWVARGPRRERIEWDIELVNDIPNELVAWKTIGNPDIAHAGSVHFRDAAGGRGTEMRIVFDYEPPGGPIGKLGVMLRDDLRRFKTTMESGEFPAAIRP
jgi:uncharacterized membrane protein